MRRAAHLLGTTLLVVGAGALVWVVLVWQWQDPFTSLYTRYEQHRLAETYDRALADYRPLHHARGSLATVRRELAAEARRYRRGAARGRPIGRIRVRRLGLDMILVDGTDHDSLEKGPGRDLRTFMPGEGRLIYIAGHRTTYLAPFSHIDSLRRGDRVTIQLPYGTFVYEITGHRVVASDDLSVLRSHGREELILQACHPRFFATNRYLAYGKLVGINVAGGPAFSLAAAGA